MAANSLSKIIQKIIGGIDVVVKTFIVLSMATMLGVICLQVFFRYGLGSSLSWPEEMARFTMIWSSLLAASYVQLERGHLSIDFVVSRLPSKLAIFLRIITNIIVIIFMIFVVYSGIQGAYNLKDLKTGALRISRAIPYMAMPVGCGMLALSTLALIFKDIIHLTKK